jgi:hypothetical protein
MSFILNRLLGCAATHDAPRVDLAFGPAFRENLTRPDPLRLEGLSARGAGLSLSACGISGVRFGRTIRSCGCVGTVSVGVAARRSHQGGAGVRSVEQRRSAETPLQGTVNGAACGAGPFSSTWCISSAPLPLTPALSLGQRENRRQPADESSGVGMIESRAWLPPLPWREDPPSLRGSGAAGRGEGKPAAQQKKFAAKDVAGLSRAHLHATPEKGRKPTPLPPSHALGAHGRGVIYPCPVPRAAARLRCAPAGLALGYSPLPLRGRKVPRSARAKSDLWAGSGCARLSPARRFINTVALARCKEAPGALQPFQRFGRARGKPLKRPGRLAAYVHHAEAAVSMRLAA